MTASRLIFDPYKKNESKELIDDQANDVCRAFHDTLPLYNISDQPVTVLDSTPVRIISPTDPPQNKPRNFLTALLSPLIMAGTMFGSRMLFSDAAQNTNLVLMYMMMPIATIVPTIINNFQQKKAFNKSVHDWREHYEQYIRNLLDNIEAKQLADITQLKVIYPPTIGEDGQSSLIRKASQVSGDIYGRTHVHPDFLSVRLGVSAPGSQLVSSVFSITNESKDVIFSSVRYKNIENTKRAPFTILMPDDAKGDEDSPYLTSLPARISERYSHLESAPVLLDLKACGTLGVVFHNNKSFSGFLDNIVLDLCFHQSPDDLQCIWFCERLDEEYTWETKQKAINKYKHLPHFRELFGDISQFVFSESDAALVLNRLLDILNARKKESTGIKLPHIVMFIQEEYGFKRHLVAEYLPEQVQKDQENLGISFVFFKRFEEELPKYCGQVIRVDTEKWYLLPHEQILKRNGSDSSYDVSLTKYSFLHDELPPMEDDLDERDKYRNYFNAFKIISSLYYYRIAQGVGVPSRVSLFELLDEYNKTNRIATDVYDECFTDENYIRLRERKIRKIISNLWNGVNTGIDVTKSLAVPIGLRAGGELVYLDLHEKSDGPHMLIAGTTGSGKTETVLTYLVGLCTLFTPEQVNLLLVDMKAGEFVNRLEGLPHIVGTVTDVQGDENGTGSVYMLRRFLKSMAAEVKRRKLLINAMGVDSIDGYIKAKKI